MLIAVPPPLPGHPYPYPYPYSQADVRFVGTVGQQGLLDLRTVEDMAPDLVTRALALSAEKPAAVRFAFLDVRPRAPPSVTVQPDISPGGRLPPGWGVRVRSLRGKRSPPLLDDSAAEASSAEVEATLPRGEGGSVPSFELEAPDDAEVAAHFQLVRVGEDGKSLVEEGAPFVTAVSRLAPVIVRAPALHPEGSLRVVTCGRACSPGAAFHHSLYLARSIHPPPLQETVRLILADGTTPRPFPLALDAAASGQSVVAFKADSVLPFDATQVTLAVSLASAHLPPGWRLLCQVDGESARRELAWAPDEEDGGGGGGLHVLAVPVEPGTRSVAFVISVRDEEGGVRAPIVELEVTSEPTLVRRVRKFALLLSRALSYFCIRLCLMLLAHNAQYKRRLDVCSFFSFAACFGAGHHPSR